MRGGPAVGSSTTNALVDGVRQVAFEQMLRHLALEPPVSPRLELLLRSWISLTETTALLWLADRRVPRAELEVRLVHDFAALAAVAATSDAGLADLLRRVLAEEPEDSPFVELIGKLVALAP
ncbi:hypothetical protein M2169_004245 [Streptomyces sp. MJP52]|nr:hypothetical protein [Streptomyces sp. MJP52]